jgi:transposase
MGIKICPATIIKAEKECFQNLEEFENVIREKLLASPVIHCDETGMKVQGKRHWLHVVSNDKYTCYLHMLFCSPKKRIISNGCHENSS